MKTFIVLGEPRENKTKEILYAGSEEEKADQFSPDLDYIILYKQEWVEGIKMKEYTKKDIYEWNLLYDRISLLEKEIERKIEELDKGQEELAKLKNISQA